MQHNPNAPTLIGEEWRPAVANTLPNYRVAAAGDAVVQRLDSTVTEIVDTIGFLVQMDTAAGSFLAETLAAGNAVEPVTTTRLLPSVVESASSTPSTPSDVLAIISHDPADPSSFLTVGSDPDAIDVTVEFPTAGVFPSRRILDVRVVVVASDPASEGLQLRIVDLKNAPNTAYWKVFANSDFFGPALQTVVANTGEIRPVSAGLVHSIWTTARLSEINTTTAPINVALLNNTVTASAMRLHAIYLEVDHCFENRYTADIVTPGQTGLHWVRYTPHKSNAAANMAKGAAGDLTTVLRQARYGSAGRPSLVAADYTFSVPYIEGSNPTPPPGLFQYPSPTLATGGNLIDLGTPAGNRTIGVDYRVAGVGSVDAQPYARVEPIPLDASAGPIQQGITGASTSNYAGVIVPCRLINGGGVTSASTLTVELRRLSDAHLMATGAILFDTAVATFPAGAGSWHVLQVPFSTPAALTSGVDYYLTLVETGPSNGGHFSAAAFITDEDFTGAGLSPDGTATYLGTAYSANFNFATQPKADLAAVAYIAYPTPAAFAAFGDTIPMAEATDCAPLGVGVSRLSWTPYGSGAGFAYYEIQRSDEYTDWATIATFSNYARHTFVDSEGRLGIESSYRIRGVATAGLMSDWSALVTATAPETGCGYTFTSNVTNNVGFGTMLAYADLNPGGALAERAVTFPEATEIKRQAIYGRPMFVSFVPADRRGDEFTRNLYLNGIVNPDTPPPSDAAPLRDMTRDPLLPYLCVRDDHGQRWFANVNVTDYLQRNPGEFQTVHVTISESIPSATPYAPAL